MKEIRSVAILGAGAVGCYLLWGLSRKPDLRLCVIAEGERRERYLRDGFRINGESYHPEIRTPEEARGADLLLVALKYDGLRPALPAIRAAAADNTMVMSLMNGVDSEDIIAEVIDRKQILCSLIKVASARKGNEVRFNPDTTIGLIYGETDPAAGRERTDAVDALLSGTGLRFRATDAILSEIWAKFRLNVSSNQAQAILGVGVGAYTDSEHAAFLRERLWDEVEALARAKGIDLSLADASSARGSKVAKSARYSTLQDLDAGRHTEVEMFAGTVVRMGRELGIPTPYNEFAYHAIKALEEKNDGLFDYNL